MLSFLFNTSLFSIRCNTQKFPIKPLASPTSIFINISSLDYLSMSLGHNNPQNSLNKSRVFLAAFWVISLISSCIWERKERCNFGPISNSSKFPFPIFYLFSRFDMLIFLQVRALGGLLFMTVWGL